MYKTYQLARPVQKRKLALLAIITLFAVLLMTRCTAEIGRPRPRAKTTADILLYLNKHGWEVEATPITVKNLQIPAKFTPAYADYNAMQKRQGFDLSRYRADIVESYSFRVLNHPADMDVFANVLVYRGRIIGGDICSFAINGFMTGFDGKTF
ncbi:MAG: DUF4830 domain-containing protein [Oscillospiraceae bacterium]|nr:DUF4830 domain-containing protein [Oscillospiraceae bacterium]